MLKKLKQHLTMPDTLTVGQYIPFQGHERLTIPGKSIPIQLDSKPSPVMPLILQNFCLGLGNLYRKTKQRLLF